MFNLEQSRAEIENRNEIRREANLPSVSIPGELRRLYQHRLQTDFEQFFQISPIRKRVEQKLLTRIRRMRGDPDWTLQAKVNAILAALRAVGIVGS
jgi:hypothetical protein